MGITPADQRLQPADAPIGQGYLWLIVKDKFIALYRAPQPAFHRQRFSGTRVEIRRIERAVLRRELGLPQGRFGVPQQDVSGQAVARKYRDTSATGNPYLLAGQIERVGKAARR